MTRLCIRDCNFRTIKYRIKYRSATVEQSVSQPMKVKIPMYSDGKFSQRKSNLIPQGFILHFSRINRHFTLIREMILGFNHSTSILKTFARTYQIIIDSCLLLLEQYYEKCIFQRRENQSYLVLLHSVLQCNNFSQKIY